MPQITGKFIKQLPVVEGETERGPWSRSGFEIMAGDEFPRMVAFTLFGAERIAMINGLQAGMTVIVDYQPESREVDDKVFTDLRCIRVSIAQRYTTPQPQQPVQAASAPAAAPAAPAVDPQFAQFLQWQQMMQQQSAAAQMAAHQPPVMPGTSGWRMPEDPNNPFNMK